MAKPVVLRGRSFRTSAEATDFFSEMLARYGDEEVIAHADALLLFQLLLRHPRAEEKIGRGVASFYRAKTDQPTSSFHLVRTDGSRTDFSFHTCIRGVSPSLEAEFRMACQRAVAEEMRLEKEKLFANCSDEDGKLPCSRSGELVTSDESTYRHTVPRFKDLVKQFVDTTGLELTAALLTPSADLQYGHDLADEALKTRFRDYHRRVRKLALFKKGILPD